MSESFTPRQRMLAAYRGQKLDRVPVAPEFWYYVPARVLGLSMIEFERKTCFWRALKQTFTHYDCEGWGIVGPRRHSSLFEAESFEEPLDGGRLEVRHVTHTPEGDLVWRQLLTPTEPAWALERPIKDFERQWPPYEAMTLQDHTQWSWQEAEAALREVGESYLLEIAVGGQFTDYVGGGREGGFQQLVFDLMQYEDYLEKLQERYVGWLCDMIRAAFAHTSAESVFIGCGWSCPSLVGPRLWRRWDKPVLKAACDATRDAGGLLHLHLHGRCAELIDDLVELGVDCLCPLERPPGGDVSPESMAAIKEKTRGRMTLNGNVHTLESLIRGGPEDVAAEVRQIIDLWADDGRLIVGTGDQVGAETPDENIHAMIETAKSYGRYGPTE